MRILVAEDERLLADLVAEGLRKQAMAVDVAYDGTEASLRLAVHDYDVLVLDRDLPGVHGDVICRDLASSGARTRILMLTAATSVPERVAGLRLGTRAGRRPAPRRRRLPAQAVRLQRTRGTGTGAGTA
jgi:DNA-binding response OmpR family regulator